MSGPRSVGDQWSSAVDLVATPGPAGWDILGGDGRIALRRAVPSVRYRVDGTSHTWTPAGFDVGDAQLVASGGPDGLTLRATLEADGAGPSLTVSCENAGPVPVTLERLTVLSVDEPRIGTEPGRWSTYRNGFQSWSGTRTLRATDRDADIPTEFLRRSTTDARHRSPTAPGHVRSDMVSAIEDLDSGCALGMGFLTTARMFGYVELDPRDGTRRLSAWCDADDVVLAPGESSTSERLGLVARSGLGAGSAALEEVTAWTGRVMDARLDGGHPGGWCSWYYYFHRVTESDVMVNLGVLAEDGRDGPRFGCSYVMVDDGYQRGIGDWLRTNPTFPSGMASVASSIRGAGFDAGIWLAPFIVAHDSPVAVEHPDWLLRHPGGRPVVALLNPAWGPRRLLALDTTNPEVVAHLEEVARTISVDWGYRILKLDFVFAAALEGRRVGGGTRAEALRAGLAAIRSGAGDDAFLLGCGSPLGPAIGLVDAMRIGADVTPSWTSGAMQIVQRRLHGLSTEHAIRNILTRAFMDGRLWDNDPDCLMVRADDTRLTIDEVRTLATAIGMTDGMAVLSDRLDRLPADRAAMVERTRALTGGRFTAIDLFEEDIPTLLVSRHADHVDVARCNLSSDERTATIEFDELGMDVADGTYEEWWTGTPVDVASNRVVFDAVPAHGTRLCRIPRAAVSPR